MRAFEVAVETVARDEGDVGETGGVELIVTQRRATVYRRALVAVDTLHWGDR